MTDVPETPDEPENEPQEPAEAPAQPDVVPIPDDAPGPDAPDDADDIPRASGTHPGRRRGEVLEVPSGARTMRNLRDGHRVIE